MQSLLLAYHELFIEHDAGPSHPERPERISTVMNAIKSTPWYENVRIVEAREANPEEVALIHNPLYFNAMRRLCEAGGQYLPSMESNIGPESYPAALRAAGAGLTLSDGIMNGKSNIGFAPTRPPGHHATKERPMGFCIFNNIAITAKYLINKYNIDRICIIDFDVHHGNGTEEAFWYDPRVLYCSLHRDNLFPYNKGRQNDTGEKEGKGFTINIPLHAGCDNEAFIKAFDRYIVPKVEEFEPQILLASAGFDAHIRDIIGGMRLTGETYAAIAERLLKLASASAEGRIISLLEGGYDLEGLVEGVLSYLGRLIEG
ncbi:MAG: histone deacetylase [Candidatus Hatepunaea meridiana]|nr:histone deacetylase [Candidatus Hatepunaea meridiana]